MPRPQTRRGQEENELDLQLLISEVDPEVKALKGPRSDGVVEKPRPLSPERQTIQAAGKEL